MAYHGCRRIFARRYFERENTILPSRSEGGVKSHRLFEAVRPAYLGFDPVTAGDCPAARAAIDEL
jgi:hypothetical protein